MTGLLVLLFLAGISVFTLGFVTGRVIERWAYPADVDMDDDTIVALSTLRAGYRHG